MIDIDWVEGAPDNLCAGMIVMWSCGAVSLAGHIDEACTPPMFEMPDDHEYIVMQDVTRWAWLVKPHELEWIEAIGARKP